MKKILILFLTLFLMGESIFALSLSTPENAKTKVPVLLVGVGKKGMHSDDIPFYNKGSIAAGDNVIFHIHGYGNGGDVLNTNFRLQNLESEFKKGTSKSVYAYVDGDGVGRLTGIAGLYFEDNVKLVYKDYTWATKLMGAEPEQFEHFHKLPNGVGGKRAMSSLGVNLGNIAKDHRSNLLIYFKAVSVNKPINGICARPRNTCERGAFVDIPDSSSEYKWYCNGFNGGKNEICTLRKNPINAKCSKTLNHCIAGWKKDIKDSSTEYLWVCKGLSGGKDANCSRKKEQKSGKCGNTKDICLVGKFEDAEDTDITSNWKCLGVNGGDSVACSIEKMCRCKPEVKQDNKPVIADCSCEQSQIEELERQIAERPEPQKCYEKKDEDPEPDKTGLKTADIFLNWFNFGFLIIVIIILSLKLFIMVNENRE